LQKLFYLICQANLFRDPKNTRRAATYSLRSPGWSSGAQCTAH